MFSKELKQLIKAALADGIVTDKERDVLRKRAESEGVNPDEVDMILDQELIKIAEEKKKKMKKRIIQFFFLIISILLVAYLCLSNCSSDKNNGSYQEAARAYDFEKAHQIIDQLHDDYLSESDYSSDKSLKRKKYEDAFDYVFNVEAKVLCAKGDEESLNRIKFLLSDIPLDGYAIPEGSKYIYNNVWDKRDEHSLYINNVTRFNEKCNNLIDLAIANHNFSLVENVLPFYKKVPEEIKKSDRDAKAERDDYENWKKKGIHKVVIDPIYIENLMTYSDGDRERAVSKINKAIDEGVFPNVTEHIK